MKYAATYLLATFLSLCWAQSSGNQSLKDKNAAYDPTNINYGFGGVLPKDVPYRPMSGDERWRMFVNDEFKNLGGYTRAIGTSIIDQRQDRPEAWEQNAGGYARRFGSRFGKFAVSSGIEHSTAYLLGHDPRYIRCRCEGFFPRFGHALAYQVVSYNREGKRVFYGSRLLGAFGGEAVSTAWLPGQKWYVEGYQGAIQQISLGTAFNVVREFGPELKRKFRWKR